MNWAIGICVGGVLSLSVMIAGILARKVIEQKSELKRHEKMNEAREKANEIDRDFADKKKEYRKGDDSDNFKSSLELLSELSKRNG